MDAARPRRPPARRRSHKPERKTFDVGGTSTIAMLASQDTAVANSAGGYLLDTAAASSAIVLNQVPIGNSSTTRVGRKFTMNALHIRCRILAPAAAAISPPLVSVALVLIRTLDRGTTTMPPQNVVFRSQLANTLTNIDNAQRFKILRKWDFMLNGDSDTAGDRTSTSSALIDEMVKLGGRETSFTQADTTGTFDDMETNALCLYVRGTQPAATATCAVAVCTRLYFTDV